MFDKDRFSQGPWRASPFHRGNLKYVILDLIKDKPRHGYEVIRALEERSHGFYTPSPGAVYPTLQMLEEAGYANVIEQDGKKVYTITKEGHQFLTERRHLTDEVESQMRHHWNPAHIGVIGQMMGEFHRLGRLVGPRLRHVEPEKIRRIGEIVSRAYQEIEGILEE